MNEAHALSIEDVEARLDDILSGTDDHLAVRAPEIADSLLTMGEAIMLAWLASKQVAPTNREVEGFRLLALHRQGARGDPSFNACRETCREIVYYRNLILHDPAAPEIARTVRLGARVVRHLALFIGGKLQEAGLGEFCCSSRPLRRTESQNPVAETA